MFALALFQKIDDDNTTAANEITFHATREAAEQKVINGLLGYVGSGPKPATMEQFIKACEEDGDSREEIEAKNFHELVEFMAEVVLGEDVLMTYAITEVPTSL